MAIKIFPHFLTGLFMLFSTIRHLLNPAPSPTLTKIPLKRLPKKINGIYIEMVMAYNNRQYILCAGAIRSLMEGICRDKKIESGLVEIIDLECKTVHVSRSNLEGKVNGLLAWNFISESEAETLHRCRYIANEALHYLRTPNLVELKSAVKLMECILSRIYESP